MRGRPLTIYGDGEQTRSYTHVSDVVRANVLAAGEELAPGENVVLNIGPNEETSVNEIAAMIGGEMEHIIPNPRGEFEELRKVVGLFEGEGGDWVGADDFAEGRHNSNC